ncbi:MAG TPA: Ig-like domain-containing protein, partial [Nitrososphaera sp.]
SDEGQFFTPVGVAVDSAGNVYVSEADSHRIQKFTSTGTFLFTLASQGGSTDGHFNVPSDIAIDLSDDSVYIVDKQNNRIQKFDSNGNFITKWGSLGSAANQFRFSDLAGALIGISVVQSQTVPSTGWVYVSDLGNHRIQVFDSDGTWIDEFGLLGSTNGQLSSPAGVAVDQNANVYVADRGNSRVQAFSSSESGDTIPPTVTTVSPDDGTTGISVTPCVCITFSENMDDATISDTTITLQDPAPHTIAGQVSYDPVNKIASFNPSIPLSYSTEYTVIVKSGASGVKDSSGNPLASDFSASFTTMSQPTGTGSHAFLGKWGTNGPGNGQFNSPAQTAIDSDGNVYVVDLLNHRIQKFKADGTFVTKWSTQMPVGQFNFVTSVAINPINNDVYVTDNSGTPRVLQYTSDGTFVREWGTEGTGVGQFGGPHGIAVDTSGNVYVSDIENMKILKFTSTGAFITEWGQEGSGLGELSSPGDLEVGPDNLLYVADGDNNRVQKFTLTGGSPEVWSTGGTPTGIAVDPVTNNVYISSQANNPKIQEFTKTGTFITGWGTAGPDEGQFNNALGIAVHPSTRNVYVGDDGSEGGRIQFFSAGAAPDTTAPIVTASYPPADFGGISVTPCVCVTFSEPMDETTMSDATIILQEPDDDIVTAQVSYDTVNKIASLNPSSPLAYSTTYMATVKGGASGVKDGAGNPLAGDHRWEFTTMS